MFAYVSTLLLFAFSYDAQGKVKNNVCKNWEDYDNMVSSPNCWFNPNINSNTAEIIRRAGYSVEEFDVVTKDEYILNLFRIVKKDSYSEDKQPVFLQHGMGTESTFWLALPNRSLAFTLAENDFDVWVGNFRGNRYGRRHKRFGLDTKEFWNYTIDDMGRYDLPAQIEVVKNHTSNGNKIIYIGHSMGTTAAFMYTAENPEKAEEDFLAIVAVSPSAYLKDMTYLRFLIPLFYPVSVELEKAISSLRINNIMIQPGMADMLKNFCLTSTQRLRLCFYISQLIFGFDEDQFLPEDFPLLLAYGTSGISFKCVTHYMQMSGSKKFQHYDHGKSINKRLYGSSKPRVYNISAISVPIHMFSGVNDALTTYKNVQKLYADLKTDKSLNMVSEDGSYHFNHIDFVVAKDVQEIFIKPVLQLLNERLLNNKIK